MPSLILLVPLLTLVVALGLRWAGTTFRRPVLGYAAGGAALVVGFGMLRGIVFTSGNLAVFAGAVSLATGLVWQPAAPASKSRKAAPPPARFGEQQLWLLLVALGGALWLGLSTRAIWPTLAAGAAILAVELLAWDAWAVAAAAVSLWAGLLAVGASTSVAALALVAAAACAGLNPLLPLTAGLGGVMAVALDQAGRTHRWPLALAILAPLTCLLLLRWWRYRFARFGRAATPLRATAAAALAALLAYSAAAMQGLR